MSLPAHQQQYVLCLVYPKLDDALLRGGFKVFSVQFSAMLFETEPYHVPCVGLAWDDKVKAFSSTTDRSDLCFSMSECDPVDVIDALSMAARRGIAVSELDCRKARAMESVNIVLQHAAHPPTGHISIFARVSLRYEPASINES